MRLSSVEGGSGPGSAGPPPLSVPEAGAGSGRWDRAGGVAGRCGAGRCGAGRGGAGPGAVRAQAWMGGERGCWWLPERELCKRFVEMNDFFRPGRNRAVRY